MKYLLLICIGLLHAWAVYAQDMKTVFVAMPDSVAPLLTKVNKEDCIDFLASNMKAVVKDRFDTAVEMKELTDDYVLLTTAANHSMEMKLLPLNDSVKVVCLIRTVCASACDSKIHFYSSDWTKKIPASEFLTLPSEDAFFLPNDTVTEEYTLIRKKADMLLMKASLSKENHTLTFEYTTPHYMSKEDREKLMPYLRKEPVVYQWNSGKYF